MRLQIHMSIDPEMSASEITDLKKGMVKEISLAVRRHASTLTPKDVARLTRSGRPVASQWERVEQGTMKAIVKNDSPTAKTLMYGNSPNTYLVQKYGGVIMRKDGKPIRFRSRKTGKIVFAKWVRPVNPERIYRTVPFAYNFRHYVMENAMWRGAESGINTMRGRAVWRGVLAVHSTPS